MAKSAKVVITIGNVMLAMMNFLRRMRGFVRLMDTKLIKMSEWKRRILGS